MVRGGSPTLFLTTLLQSEHETDSETEGLAACDKFWDLLMDCDFCDRPWQLLEDRLDLEDWYMHNPALVASLKAKVAALDEQVGLIRGSMKREIKNTCSCPGTGRVNIKCKRHGVFNEKEKI